MGCSAGDCFKCGPAIAWGVTPLTPGPPRSPHLLQLVLLALNVVQSALSLPGSASLPVMWRQGESPASWGPALPAPRCVRVQRDLRNTALFLVSSPLPPEARLLLEVDEDHLGKKHSLYKVLQVHLCRRYVSSLSDLL